MPILIQHTTGSRGFVVKSGRGRGAYTNNPIDAREYSTKAMAKASLCSDEMVVEMDDESGRYKEVRFE